MLMKIYCECDDFFMRAFNGELDSLSNLKYKTLLTSNEQPIRLKFVIFVTDEVDGMYNE